jgi:hypothetical protein
LHGAGAIRSPSGRRPLRRAREDGGIGIVEGVLAHSGGEPRDDVALVVLRMP